jgi:carbamoyl-phosphate synthase large subunit
VFKRVDTCAAEFASSTAYMYSTYEEECEAAPTDAKKDHGPRRRAEPHRPGHRVRLLLRARRLRAARDGYETIMVNCNPETVSTDYDTSDRLYFEPLTLEDVLEIVDKSARSASSSSTAARRRSSWPATSRPPACPSSAPRRTPSIWPRTASASSAWSTSSACAAAERHRPQRERGPGAGAEIGYPLVVRPSYVLGGRAMEMVYDETDLRRYIRSASASPTTRRCCSTASSTTPSRWTSTRSATASRC